MPLQTPSSVTFLLAASTLTIMLVVIPRSRALAQVPYTPAGSASAAAPPASSPSATTPLQEPPAPTPPPEEEKKGGSGESCTKASDCQANFKCILQVCTDPTLGTDGDSCAKATDCNSNLRCIENRCASPTTVATRPPAEVEPDPVPAQESHAEFEHSLDPLRGFRATAALGYAGTSMEDLDGGLAYNLSIAFKFHRVAGVTGWIGNMSLTEDRVGGDLEATLPRYLAGFYIGNRVVLEVLGGSVGASSSGSSGDSSFAVGASFGGELGPWRYFAISPSVFILYPTDKGFLGNEVLYGMMIGTTFRVPRTDE